MTSTLPDHLIDTLDMLGFTDSDGLIVADTQETVGAKDYIWRDMRDRVGLEAAFFLDGVPVVGFSSAWGSNLAGLRRRLWNFGRVPLLIAAQSDQVSVYSASTDFNPDEDEPLVTAATRQARIAGGLLAAFSRIQIEAGSFATQYADAYAPGTRVDEALLSNLAYLRRRVARDEARRGAGLDAFVGGCLLASYLADRGVLDEVHLEEICGFRSILEALGARRNGVGLLFSGLAEHFNGDIFGGVIDSIEEIHDSDIAGVAGLLRGDDLPTGQGKLWPYDFAVLPADLVSNVYEQLLESSRRDDAAFYTPRFLVDLILDEVLGWERDRLPDIIDLACGSGAFITEAYRRLTYRKRSQLGREPTFDELVELLQSHIFGIDKNSSAATVTVFGLYLTLLEQLDPPTVWTTATLPPLLGQNVLVGDAFEQTEVIARRFDIVVGNPPWESRLTVASSRFLAETGKPVADKQIAQAFVWLAAAILRPGGALGLVLPAKGLLHNRSNVARKFRTALFASTSVRAIVDLSAIRRAVFATAIAPAAVLVADVPQASQLADAGVLRNDASDHLIHVAPHARALTGTVGALVVAPEEVRTLRRSQAAARPDLWRVLLWGSERDLDLIDRLRSDHPSLGDVARKHEWISGQGFQVGGGDENDATHLVGLPVVETRAIQPLHIARGGVTVLTNSHLHRPRDPRLYHGPHTLIKRTTLRGRLVAAFVEDDLAFSNGVIGFAAPQADADLLITLAASVVSSLGQYWHFMTSASWGVEREFVEVNEHESFPLATPKRSQVSDLKALFNNAERLPITAWQAELDNIVFDIYRLTDSERERVTDAMTDSLGRYLQPGGYSQSHGSPREYIQILQRSLPSVLGDMPVNATSYRDGRYQVVVVTLGRGEGGADGRARAAVDTEAIVAAQAASRDSTSVVSLPAGFFVDDDSFYIVKTADRDRWTRDSALDDADRILAVLLAEDENAR